MEIYQGIYVRLSPVSNLPCILNISSEGWGSERLWAPKVCCKKTCLTLAVANAKTETYSMKVVLEIDSSLDD